MITWFRLQKTAFKNFQRQMSYAKQNKLDRSSLKLKKGPLQEQTAKHESELTAKDLSGCDTFLAAKSEFMKNVEEAYYGCGPYLCTPIQKICSLPPNVPCVCVLYHGVSLFETIVKMMPKSACSISLQLDVSYADWMLTG